MSPDLNSQLAEYGEFHDEQQSPIDMQELAELREAIRTLPFAADPPLSDRRRHGWLVAAAAMLAVLLLIGGIAWITGTTPDAVAPTDQPSATTNVEQEQPPTSITDDQGQAATTVAPTTPLAPAGPTLRAIMDPEDADRIDVVFDVVETPSGLLAITKGTRLYASRDGANWEPLSADSPGTLGNHNVAGLASSRVGTIFATVTDEWAPGYPENDFGVFVVRAWFTEDGINWVPSEAPHMRIPHSSIVGGDSGFVALQPQRDTNLRSREVWFSADGIEWFDTQLRVDGRSLMTSTQGGFLLAESRPGRTTLWRSDNGLDWEAASQELPWRVVALAGSERGVIAVSDAGVVAFSTDGETWDVDAAELPGLTDGASVDAAASEEGFVVAGDLAWFSLDGSNWTVASSPSGVPERPPNPVWRTITFGSAFLIAGPAGDAGPLWLLEP